MPGFPEFNIPGTLRIPNRVMLGQMSAGRSTKSITWSPVSCAIALIPENPVKMIRRLIHMTGPIFMLFNFFGTYATNSLITKSERELDPNIHAPATSVVTNHAFWRSF